MPRHALKGVPQTLPRIYRRTAPIARGAALVGRPGRMSCQIERLAQLVAIPNETLGMFVRFWLTSTTLSATRAGLDRRSEGLFRAKKAAGLSNLAEIGPCGLEDTS